MSKRKFFSGNSVRQAVVSAASHFDLPPDEVAYREVDKKHGFLKMRKRVIIEVDADDPRRQPVEIPAIEPEPGDRGGKSSKGGGKRKSGKGGGRGRHANHDYEQQPPPDYDDGGGRRPSAKPMDDGDDDRGNRIDTRGSGGRSGGRKGGDDQGQKGGRGGSQKSQGGRGGSGRGGSERGDSGRGDSGRGGSGRSGSGRGDSGRGGSGRGGSGRGDSGRSGSGRGDSGRGDSQKGRSGGRSGKGRSDDDRSQRGSRSDAKSGSRSDSKQRGGGGRRDDRGRDDSRGGKQERGGGAKGSSRGGDRGRGKGRGGRRNDEMVELSDRSKSASERYREEAKGEMADGCREALERVLDVAGIEVDYKVFDGDDRYEVDLSGPDEELLVAEGGDLLRAIEHLVPRAMRGVVGDSRLVRVNCGDFHEIHEERLRSQAQTVAAEVRRTNKPSRMEPMSPADRRIVHVTLADEPGISTNSDGNGHYKQVVVKPA